MVERDLGCFAFCCKDHRTGNAVRWCHSLFCDVSCHVDTAGGGVGQRVGDAAAVTDDVQAGVAGFQLFADLHLHVVELDLHAVEQGIVVGGAGGHLVQGEVGVLSLPGGIFIAVAVDGDDAVTA